MALIDDLRAPAVTAAIHAHARAEYPRESCGLVVRAADGRALYRPCRNVSNEPKSFRIDPEEYLAAAAEGAVIGLAHSHCAVPASATGPADDGPPHPSAADMTGQMASAMPWAIVLVTDRDVSDVVWWGDQLEPPPLLGREFRHGPSGSDGRGDCGALIRDWFRIERGVTIPDFARDDAWWDDGRDLYRDNFAAAGFVDLGVKTALTDPRPGDVFLAKLKSVKVPHHGGVYVGGGLIIHHLPFRLSRRDPVAPWLRHAVTHWLRHVTSVP